MLVPRSSCQIAHGPQGVEHGGEQGGAVDHGGVDHLALAGALGAAAVRHTIPKASSIPPPPKSPTRLSGGTGASPRPADGVEGPGQSDVVDVVTRGGCVGAVLAPARHAAVDQSGVPSQHDVGPEPEPLHHARTEPLDEAVGLLGQGQDRLDPVGVLEVDADGAPASVVDVGGRGGRVAAGDVLRPVDPDHVGAHVGQHHGGEGPRADPRQLDDLQAREGSGHAGSSLWWFRPRGCGRPGT